MQVVSIIFLLLMGVLAVAIIIWILITLGAGMLSSRYDDEEDCYLEKPIKQNTKRTLR